MKKLNLSKQTMSDLKTYALVVISYIVVQILIATNLMNYHMQGMLVTICSYIILAVSLNLTVGILGELSLGHAGFMCIGAYVGATFSICTRELITIGPLRFFLALLIGAVVAGLAGLLIGTPVLRLKGDYLAIVTLAFGEIIKNVCNIIYMGYDSKGLHFSTQDTLALGLEEDGVVVIKGAQGVTGMPQDSNFTIGVLLILLTLYIVLHLIHSRDGRAIMSIRDNQIAAESVGIHISKYKLLAFSVSAALAGMAGVFYMHSFGNQSASKFDYNLSISILVFVVLGGIGSIRGSIIAATILTLLPEVLREILYAISSNSDVSQIVSNSRMLIYSIILIFMMIFNWCPAIQDKKKKFMSKFKSKKNKVATETIEVETTETVKEEA